LGILNAVPASRSVKVCSDGAWEERHRSRTGSPSAWRPRSTRPTRGMQPVANYADWARRGVARSRRSRRRCCRFSGRRMSQLHTGCLGTLAHPADGGAGVEATQNRHPRSSPPSDATGLALAARAVAAPSFTGHHVGESGLDSVENHDTLPPVRPAREVRWQVRAAAGEKSVSRSDGIALDLVAERGRPPGCRCIIASRSWSSAANLCRARWPEVCRLSPARPGPGRAEQRQTHENGEGQ